MHKDRYQHVPNLSFPMIPPMFNKTLICTNVKSMQSKMFYLKHRIKYELHLFLIQNDIFRRYAKLLNQSKCLLGLNIWVILYSMFGLTIM